MPTITDLLKHAGEIDSDSPQLDAQLLLAHVLDCSRTHLYTWPERAVSEADEQRFLELVTRRKRGEPVAYLLGKQEFWSLSLKVSPSTLIPRGDTELLVEKALALPLPDSARVLDLGTGTGAVALALASERPRWRVVAVDREQDAVRLAAENARVNNLSGVEVVQSDWFSAVTGRFELIVGNPPYVAENDPHLREGDVRFEPVSALVAGEDGLADISRIVADAAGFLEPGGWLMLEHGHDQGERLRALFAEAGYGKVQTAADLAGLPRVTFGRLIAGSR